MIACAGNALGETVPSRCFASTATPAIGSPRSSTTRTDNVSATALGPLAKQAMPIALPTARLIEGTARNTKSPMSRSDATC
jgi:hypothetical protein